MATQSAGLPRSNTTDSLDSTASASPTRRKGSPNSKFTFFGWKSSSTPQNTGHDSPPTPFSESEPSLLSESTPSLSETEHAAGSAQKDRLAPPALDIQRANSSTLADAFTTPITPFPSQSYSDPNKAHIEDLEHELREVSQELAGSIRREMELEDEIDRFKSEMPSNMHDLTRRTSDYFSDSGASSTRFPLGDNDAKLEELERSKRKVEQEKALVRADYSQKLADELRQRKTLEAHIQQLEQELHNRQANASLSSEKAERVRELEQNLQDSRRRLSQERSSRDNFEGLLAALKEELYEHRSDRDNLRDEVVPQLKARIEGLEAEAAEVDTLRYENARMQQEVQAMKEDRQVLLEVQSSGSHSFGSIAEEVDVLSSPRFPKMGLSRSNSLARSPSTNTLKRGSSLSRSLSVKDKGPDGRQHPEFVPGDRFKDLEDQRDALHSTLKHLLQRHETQKREHSKALRKLVVDRDRARAVSHGRSAFARDVNDLREEVGSLRRRADNALEQKWQYESNLGGVKMALDRAGQETKSLRTLFGPDRPGSIQRLSSGSLQRSSSSSSSALRLSVNTDGAEAETHSVIRVLRRSITLAENERDAALREAEAYRTRARSLQAEHMDREHELADQLLEAASRMEELAAQVQQHLSLNVQLKERLAQAVGKGEEEQSDSTARVVQMQSRLKTMEERVLAAQQQSESTLGRHEEEAKQIEASTNSPILQRLKIPGASLLLRGPASPLFSAKSPKIGQTTSGPAESLFEASKTATLQRRVNELELALAEADNEMKGVVQRIESSQYEIAELQGERDEAKGAMRRLQARISAEKEKAHALMA